MQVALLAFFTLTVGIYAAEHGVHGVETGDLAPSWAVFIVAAPVLVYNFIGFELPSTTAEEMRDPQRDVPRGDRQGGRAHGHPVLHPDPRHRPRAPAGDITSLTGFIDALASVFVVYGPAADAVGAVAAAAFVCGALHERAHVGDRVVAHTGRRQPRRRGAARAGSDLRADGHAGAGRRSWQGSSRP